MRARVREAPGVGFGRSDGGSDPRDDEDLAFQSKDGTGSDQGSEGDYQTEDNRKIK